MEARKSESGTRGLLETSLLTVLDKYDVSHKGVYRTQEVGTIVRLVGFDPSLRDIAELTRQLDPGNGGTFTEAQLLEVLKKYPFKRYTEKDMLEAMQTLDGDNDGLIDAKTLKEILTERGEKLSTEEYSRFITGLDPSNTGSVKVADLLKVLKQQSYDGNQIDQNTYQVV